MKFNFNEIIAKITRTPIRMVYDIIEPKSKHMEIYSVILDKNIIVYQS